ncbi:MAG: UDP-N-acetylmuramoyl-tripeptide--D-alanyl-D-alanine ligase [Propionibacteriaceae bacterium]
MITIEVHTLADRIDATVVPADTEAVPIGPDVVIDSRRATPGSLFVALPGERMDGHDFAVAAAEAGAAAVLCAHPVEELGVPALVVDDVQAALGRIGAAVVADARPRGLQVIGITGSQGKTSTKDLIAQLLEAVGPTIAPEGSFNNEIGVPLTASRVEVDTRFLVSEMGARGIGHIRYLTTLTPPDLAIVLNVGQAHLGEFGSREGIARAKGELVAALPADGAAVLNADDPLVLAMADRTEARLWLFAEGAGPDPGAVPRPVAGLVRATDITSDDLGRRSFRLVHSGDGVEQGDGAEQSAPVRLQLIGAHQVSNALAAATAALAIGQSLPRVAELLSAAGNRSAWRMELHRRPDGVVVVNDAYNANPESTLAACRTLDELGRQRAEGARTIAVLGDMLELGEVTTAEHERVGRAVAALGIDLLLAVGENAAALVVGAEAGGMAGRALATGTKEAAEDWLAAHLAPGDVVLVKGSRRLGLETMAEALVASGTTGTGATQ